MPPKPLHMLRGCTILAGLAVVAGCTPYDLPDTGYARRPYPLETYAPPPVYTAPVYPQYAPLPPPPPESVAIEPLDPAPPSAFLPPLDPAGEPPPPDTPAPLPTDQAATPGPSDPVTDLLLTPLPQRDAAQGAIPAPTKTQPPAQNPFMGFRPMRGQTAPAP